MPVGTPATEGGIEFFFLGLSFFLAVLVHIVYQWLGWWWKPEHRSTPFAYFTPDGYLPLVLKGLIADIVIFFAYYAGWLDGVIETAAAILPEDRPIDPRRPLVAALAGFLADSGSKTFMEILDSLGHLIAKYVKRFLPHRNGNGNGNGKIGALFLALLLLTGCAAFPTPEPVDPSGNPVDAKLARAIEVAFRFERATTVAMIGIVETRRVQLLDRDIFDQAIVHGAGVDRALGVLQDALERYAQLRDPDSATALQKAIAALGLAVDVVARLERDRVPDQDGELRGVDDPHPATVDRALLAAQRTLSRTAALLHVPPAEWAVEDVGSLLRPVLSEAQALA